jgi:hypothetical protein
MTERAKFLVCTFPDLSSNLLSSNGCLLSFGLGLGEFRLRSVTIWLSPNFKQFNQVHAHGRVGVFSPFAGDFCHPLWPTLPQLPLPVPALPQLPLPVPALPQLPLPVPSVPQLPLPLPEQMEASIFITTGPNPLDHPRHQTKPIVGKSRPYTEDQLQAAAKVVFFTKGHSGELTAYAVSKHTGFLIPANTIKGRVEKLENPSSEYHRPGPPPYLPPDSVHAQILEESILRAYHGNNSMTLPELRRVASEYLEKQAGVHLRGRSDHPLVSYDWLHKFLDDHVG